MENYFSTYAISMDTNDLFVLIGWCPEKVRLTTADGQQVLWYRLLGNDASFERVAAGDITASTGAGIKLVKFTDTALNTSSDPSTVDPANYIDANGIQITSDVAFLANDAIVFVEAWRMCKPFLRAVHDGTTSSNTYFEDASFDFHELGVCGNGKWLIYNQTNANYAYIKEVTKPLGKTKYCRLYTATDAAGTATTAADFDTSDVCIIFPVDAAWYPLSDVGLMT